MDAPDYFTLFRTNCMVLLQQALMAAHHVAMYPSLTMMALVGAYRDSINQRISQGDAVSGVTLAGLLWAFAASSGAADVLV